MILSNTIQLTQSQEEYNYQIVSGLFEEKLTDDYWHFSFEGTRLNFDNHKQQAVYEVHSSKGSFNVLIDLNKNNKALKSLFKIEKI